MQRAPNDKGVRSIQRSTAKRALALVVGSALAFAVVPVNVPDLGPASAWAKGGNGGGGGGGNGGGGNGGGDGNGGGGGNSGGGSSGSGGGSGGGSGNGGNGGNAGGGRGGDNSGGFGAGGFGNTRTGGEEARGAGRGERHRRAAAVGGLRDASGPGKKNAAKDEARGRYAAAAGWSDDTTRPGDAFDRPSFTLDDALTASLVARGWEEPTAAESSGFRNHGHRVSSMVEIAKALGYSAHVGALQANFGDAHAGSAIAETDSARERLTAEMTELGDAFAALEDPESDEARALQDRLGEIEDELAALDATAAELADRDGDWRTADLDVNGDGVVDLADLEAARQFAGSEPGEPAADDEPVEQVVQADETTSEAEIDLVDVQ